MSKVDGLKESLSDAQELATSSSTNLEKHQTELQDMRVRIVVLHG